MSRTHLERLVAYVTDGSLDRPIAAELLSWASESPRFRAFADAHRDKIRKKLRGATTPDAMLDVRAELAVASRLLDDRRIGLAFEGYGSSVGGPDFTLTFRGHAAFDLEVTRIRAGAPATAITTRVLGKLRQLRSGTASALLLVLDGEPVTRIDLDAVDASLRSHAKAGDDAFFARHAFAGAGNFRVRYARLGGVFTYAGPDASGAGATLWRNPGPRIALPIPAASAVLAALRA